MAQFRRFLIAAGTARYDNLPDDQQLPSVERDLAQIVECFTARGYQQVLMDVSKDPTADELRKALGRSFKDRTASDHVVFYYSGHGECIDKDGHYLVCRDAEYHDGKLLASHAYADEELAKAISNSEVQHALIILDTCFSTAGLLGFSAKAFGLFFNRPRDTDLPHGIHLIAASSEIQKAMEGVFSKALCDALANRDGKLGGTLQPFLRPVEVVGAVNASPRVPQEARYLLATPLTDADVQLLPNPRFEPGRPEGLTLADHWIPKAQGGSLDSRAWYFTGRACALQELVAWLSAPDGDGKARVVTGSAGCGKSALLARLVLFSDPGQRARAEAAAAMANVDAATIPPVGCIDHWVHARGKTLDEIGAEIGAAAQVLSGSPREIIDALKARAVRFTLVVDALDESKEPDKIARELLRQIAPLPAVRLLLGSRPDSASTPGGQRFAGIGRSTVELDLDDPRYLGATDLKDYLTRRLLAAEEPNRHTPYRGRRDLAGPVAKAVAARGGRVFLVTRLLADTLVEADRALTAAEAAALDFPATVGAAFEKYLEQFDRDGDLSKASVIDLLRPLAYAEGAGLPWGNIWPAIATALAGSEYVDQDIERLGRRIGSFVTEALEDGRSVYRLYHEALAEHLRAGRHIAHDQRTVTDALMALVPARPDGRKEWPNAGSYIRTHLASHAMRGRMLDQLISDPLYLAAAERHHLLRAVRQLGPNESGELYESAFHNLQTADLGERLAYLELAAHQNGRSAWIERAAAIEFEPPWRVQWLNWAGTGTHREIYRCRGTIAGLMTLELDGRSLAIVAHYFEEGLRDGTIQYSEVLAYDIADGSLHFCTPHLSFVTIMGLAPAEIAGEPIVVAVTREGGILRWRARDGEPLGGPIDVRRVGDEVCDLDHFVTAVIDHRPCVAFSARSVLDVKRVTLVDVWDLETGEPWLEQPIRLGDVGIVGLAVVPESPFAVLISADSERVRLWDLSTGTLQEQSEPIERLTAFAATADCDALRLVIGSGESIQVWSALDDNSRLAHGHAGHADGATCLALAKLGIDDVILSGGRDHVARIWRMRDSELLFETLVGFGGVPTHLALAQHRDRTEMLTADMSGALLASRVSRETPAAATHARTLPHCGWVDGLHIVETQSSGWCVATHSRDGTVRAWQAETGRPWAGALGEAAVGQAVTAGVLGGRLTVFTCDTDGTFSRRDETGTPHIINREGAGKGAAVHLALAGWQGQDYLVSVDADGEIAVQDVNTERVVAQFASGLTGPMSGICILNSQAGPLLVTCAWTASSFSIWNLLQGRGAGSGPSKAGWVSACAGASVAGRPLLLSSHDEKGLLLWDLDSGRPVGDLRFWTSARALALAEVDGQRFAACADSKSRLNVWCEDKCIASLQTGCTVKSLAFVPRSGILVAGCEGMMLIRL